MGYLLAVLLSVVYKIPPDRIVITGRNHDKLAKFWGLANGRFDIAPYILDSGDYNYGNNNIVNALRDHGKPGDYDIAFDCVGGESTSHNINLAMKCLKKGGTLALEGITNGPVDINFKILIEKNIFVKGFYRGSLNAYSLSLNYIEEYKEIRDYLEKLIDKETIINSVQGFHIVKNENDLIELFNLASKKRGFGRLIINELS